MIKFEEHDDNLFRMLEEPVPLTDDAELPVLVRLIQDDTMLGKANKRSCHPDTLAEKIICSSSNLTDDGLFMNGNYAYRYEIIGTFVKEGSAEWALYQMMQGKMVCHETSPWDWYRIYNDHAIQNRTVGYMDRVSAWLESTVQSGWQIYTEPKPESENIIHGHIPADMHLKYFHLCKFKVGDWVEFIDVGGHKSQGKYLSNDCDHAIVLDITCNMRCVVPMTKIIRKLKPSEVVLHFGSGISGTIKRWDSTTFHIFHGNSKFSKIHIDALDAPTRELVEGLLKAQKDE